MTKIELQLPEDCVYNVGIAVDGKTLVSDSNNSSDWRTYMRVLPDTYTWQIVSRSGRDIVVAIK